MRKSLQAIVLLKNFTIGILAPVLTLALLARGATLHSLSLLIGAYSLTVIVAEFPSGLFADLYGRKTAFAISSVLALCCYGLLLLAHSGAALLGAMVLSGLGRAFSSGSIDALAIDAVADDAALVRVTARLSMLESAGLALGALAGGLLASLGAAYAGNLAVNLLLSMVLLLLTLLTVHEKPAARTRKDTRYGTAIPTDKMQTGDPSFLRAAPDENAQVLEPAETRSNPSEPSSLRDGLATMLQADPAKAPTRPTLGTLMRQSLIFALRRGPVRKLFALAMLTGFAMLAVETYWQPALTTFAPPAWLLGAVSFAGFLSVIVGSRLTEKLLSRAPKAGLPLLLGLKALLGGSLILLVLVRGQGAFAGAYMLAYLLLGGGGVAESLLLNREAPSSQRASILSLFSFVLQIGGLMASLVGYAVSAAGSYRVLWLMAGALLISFTGVLSLLGLRKRRSAGGTQAVPTADGVLVGLEQSGVGKANP